MNIKDATITIVENFPHQLVRCEIIQDKQSDTLFIRKDLFASAVAEFIAEHNYVKAAAEPPAPRVLSSLSDTEAKTAFELAFPGKEFDCADWDFDSEYIIRGREGETLRIFDDGDMICEKGVYSREFKAARLVRYLDSLGIALGE